MKKKCILNEFKKELQKLQNKISNKTAVFILVGVIISILSILFIISKLKNRNLLCEDDDFYYDDEDFYEDYHALDYEDDEDEQQL